MCVRVRTFMHVVYAIDMHMNGTVSVYRGVGELEVTVTSIQCLFNACNMLREFSTG